MRDTIIDLVVAKYVIGAVLVVTVLVIGGGLGIFHAIAERRRTNRAIREIMEMNEVD